MKRLLGILLVALILGCGGGGGSSESPQNNTVTDTDGNIYNTVTIGTQVWMKENLKVTKYRNGDVIATTASPTHGETSPKYQWAYNDNEMSVSVYGRLYTWYAATDSRGICPTGWHVPTYIEWATLTDNLGGSLVAGGKLKEAGLTHWYTPNIGADNSSGFTALPGGIRDSWGSFYLLTYNGYWWTATENATGIAMGVGMSSSFIDAEFGGYSKDDNGLSVRCLKD